MPFCVLMVSVAMKWKLAQRAQNQPLSSSVELGPVYNKEETHIADMSFNRKKIGCQLYAVR